MNTKKGFTLIELLIVMAIIGLMAALIIVNLTESTRRSRDASRKNDISELRKALRLYFDDHKVYPSSSDDDGQGWDDSSDGEFIKKLVDGGYIKSAIVDPRNTGSYKYSYRTYDDADTSCQGGIYVLGVRQFESEGKLVTNARCPGQAGLSWEQQFHYVIVEGE